MSMLMSSLMPEELSLGIAGGGGVLIRSSKLFQNADPPLRMAWLVNVLEERRLNERSLPIDASSEFCSTLSNGPAVAGARLGDDAVVVG